MPQRDAATLRVLTEDVLKTSEIEGEHLNPETVRSSIARRLGLDIGALAPADRHVDGVVEMVLDATGAYARPLTRERLFGWHAALFPTGYSGLAPIRTGAWRDDAAGPMQVVSGPVGRRKVHFEAPPARRLEAEVARFLEWFELSRGGDPLVHAGLAHLWFVTLHPFDDGNGRIARAVGDMALGPRRRIEPALLQPFGPDPARAQGLLRHAGADAEGHDGCHAVAGLVPGLPAARDRGRGSIAVAACWASRASGSAGP